MPLHLILGSASEYPEEQLPIYRVVGLLQIHEEIKLPLLPAVYFLQKSTGMDGRGLALLEACLVDLRRQEMWSPVLHLRQDGLLHDLGDVLAHHDGTNFIKSHRSLSRRLLKRHHSPDLQICRDCFGIERVHDLVRYLVPQGLVRLQDVAVEAVRAQSLVEVSRLDSISDVCDSEELLQVAVSISC